MTEKTEQLKTEFNTRLEAMGTEIRSMFEQMMLQMKSITKSAIVEVSEGSGGVSSSKARMKSVIVTGTKAFTTPMTDHVDLTELGRIHTKLSKLECPRFNGIDFKGWLLKIEQFFVVDQNQSTGQGQNGYDAS